MIILKEYPFLGDAIKGGGLNNIIDATGSVVPVDGSVTSPIVGKKKENVRAVLTLGKPNNCAGENKGDSNQNHRSSMISNLNFASNKMMMLNCALQFFCRNEVDQVVKSWLFHSGFR